MHGGNVHNFWATQYVVKIEEKSNVFIPNIRFLIVQKNVYKIAHCFHKNTTCPQR